MNNKIRNDNYVLMQGWMINELNLKNNELFIYAIIYGFSQITGNEFTGSLQYLADWCSCTKQGVIKCLKSLISKNLIIKNEIYKNNVKFCTYSINSDMLTKFTGIKQSLVPAKQSLIAPIKQSLPNNIENNNIDNNITNIEKIYNKKELSLKATKTNISKESLGAPIREDIGKKEIKRRTNPLPPDKKSRGLNDRNWVDYLDIRSTEGPPVEGEIF